MFGCGLYCIPSPVNMFLLTLASLLLHLAACKQKCCDHVGCFTNDYPFNSMPLPRCPDAVQASMKVYTRATLDDGQLVTRTTVPPAYLEDKDTIFVTHGYLNWNDIWFLVDFKNTLLTKFDCNVIIVNWGPGAQEVYYPQAASNSRIAGAEIALVAENLVEHTGANRTRMWCVGHSLGSHVCGHAGQRYKFGRITGLDPAGPWFEDKDSSIGINPSVADFVDIWHTNGLTALVLPFGMLKSLGHVDFYPNGGGRQPGCVLDTYTSEGRNQTDIDQLDLDPSPSCSHLRALWLFQEAISSRDCAMYAKQKCEDPYNIPESCYLADEDDYQVMGLDADEFAGRGLYYLQTDSSSPYCKQED